MPFECSLGEPGAAVEGPTMLPSTTANIWMQIFTLRQIGAHRMGEHGSLLQNRAFNTFNLEGSSSVRTNMKRSRKAKTRQPSRSRSDSELNPPSSRHTWQSSSRKLKSRWPNCDGPSNGPLRTLEGKKDFPMIRKSLSTKGRLRRLVKLIQSAINCYQSGRAGACLNSLRKRSSSR